MQIISNTIKKLHETCRSDVSYFLSNTLHAFTQLTHNYPLFRPILGLGVLNRNNFVKPYSCHEIVKKLRKKLFYGYKRHPEQKFL